jgi:hypothetical protein
LCYRNCFFKKKPGSGLYYKKRWELQEAGFSILKLPDMLEPFSLLDKTINEKENLVSEYTLQTIFFKD